MPQISLSFEGARAVVGAVVACAYPSGLMALPLKIAGNRVGPRERCFVIAEAGANHNGNIAVPSTRVDG